MSFKVLPKFDIKSPFWTWKHPYKQPLTSRHTSHYHTHIGIVWISAPFGGWKWKFPPESMTVSPTFQQTNRPTDQLTDGHEGSQGSFTAEKANIRYSNYICVLEAQWQNIFQIIMQQVQGVWNRTFCFWTSTTSGGGGAALYFQHNCIYLYIWYTYI